MLKKIVVAAYVGIACFLTSFTPKISSDDRTQHNKIQEQPIDITWQVLANMNASLQVMSNYGNIIKENVHGKKIKVSGFVIPIDSKSYVLSKNVYSHCFFCSTSAGAETILGIQFKSKPPRLKTDTYISLEGTFFYNDKNSDDWKFSIHNAVITYKK